MMFLGNMGVSLMAFMNMGGTPMLRNMPTYEYKCDACGYEFERFHSITADPIKRCPHCGKAKVRRLIGTGAGLIFKGSGFYITDYRDKSYTDKAKAESGSSDSSGEGKSEGSADSKPAENKSESKPAETKAETKPKAEPKPEKSASKSAKKK
jgi:putative FmdB family regulatory protein